jgi:exopolysaccharide biosynthesis predicted pyruvyltransferase EpsI
LVDPAYHGNVGDNMLTLGELELLQSFMHMPLPQQCHYVQAGGFYDVCTDVMTTSSAAAASAASSTNQTKVALWHVRGNWGDLWRDAQEVRIPSFRTILNHGHTLISMPQSLFYLDDMLKEQDVIAIKETIALGLGLAEEELEENWSRSRRRRLDQWEEDGRNSQEGRWEEFDGHYSISCSP